MRKIYILLFTLIAAWSLTGCTRENLEQAAGSGEILIRLKVDAIQTKSAGTADENYVESLQVLVFKDITAAPAKYVNLTSEITAGETTYEKEYATLTDFGGFTADELLNATVFAVANYSGSLSSVGSLAAAKALAVDASGFLTTSPDGEVVKPSPRFIMIAEGGFTRETVGGTNKAMAILTLTRLAAKVSLVIKYDDSGTDGLITTEDTVAGTTTVWTPMSEGNVRVYLSNAVNNAKLGGDPADAPVRFFYADDHPTGEGTLTSTAFYTYPATWDEGSDDAPFLKIIQPWSYKTVKEQAGKPVIIDQNVVELYYKVMLPGLTAFAANTWYQPTVTLNVLGGESSRNMTVLTTSGFDILPWGSVGGSAGGLSPIAIDPAKYLAIERNHTTVNNGDGVTIKYVASGPTTLTVMRVYKEVFVNDGMEDREIFPTKHSAVLDTYPGTGSIASGSSDAWFTNTYGTNTDKPNEGTIILTHQIASDMYESNGVTRKSNFAARPYEYRLKLHLASEGSDPSLDREFTITQNPAWLAEGQLSQGWVCVNGIDTKNSSFGSSTTSTTGITTYVQGTGTYNTANVYSNGNGYQPRTSGAYGNYYYVRLAGKQTDASHSAYINTKSRCPSANTSDAWKVDNLGTIHTYNYLAPSGGNSSQWRIIIHPCSRDDMFIMDPRIDISSDTGHEMYKIINTHVTSANGTSVVDGSPLLKNGSSTDAYTEIKKYMPTGTNYSNVVAPAVMFASSYGKTTSINYFASALRCAAYQEDGYPAGRWRLPTVQEMMVAIELASFGAIPSLFNTSGKYWAASGEYIYYDSGQWKVKDNPTDAELTAQVNTSNLTGVRCVYDTWYWGEDEEDALKTSDYQSNYNNPQYNWSGYGYTRKPTI